MYLCYCNMIANKMLMSSSLMFLNFLSYLSRKPFCSPIVIKRKGPETSAPTYFKEHIKDSRDMKQMSTSWQYS